MARLEEWFDEWALSLRDRSGRTDWPDMTTDAGWEFWQDFRRALARCGANWAEADEAASAACDVPGLYVSQYRPMIVEAIRAIQARNLAAQAGACAASSPEAARIASRDCPDCRGDGFATRYVHPEILGKVRTFGGGEAPVGTGVSYPCSCPLGRLVAAGLRQPGQARDPLTVDDYPSLRLRPVPWSDRPDNQFRHPPGRWDAAAGRPAGDVVIRTPAELRAHTASLAGSFSARRAPAPEEPCPASAAADPVIDRERRREAAPPREVVMPEDDWTLWP